MGRDHNVGHKTFSSGSRGSHGKKVLDRGIQCTYDAVKYIVCGAEWVAGCCEGSWSVSRSKNVENLCRRLLFFNIREAKRKKFFLRYYLRLPVSFRRKILALCWNQPNRAKRIWLNDVSQSEGIMVPHVDWPWRDVANIMPQSLPLQQQQQVFFYVLPFFHLLQTKVAP